MSRVERARSTTRWHGTALAILFLGMGASPAQADSHLVFDRTAALDLTLETDLRTLVRQAPRGVELDASLRLADGPTLAVRLTPFGKSRLRVCQLPPLLLSLPPDAGKETPFEGLSTLRMVTHCRAKPSYDRSLLIEYLVYRAWGLVAEPALRVRLATVHYRDVAGRRRTESHPAFLVEEIAAAAARRGLTWSQIQHQKVAELEPRRAAVYYLFQYMIGNTDWSAVIGPEGERCCHNTALLEDPASGERFLLPYDFDQSGVVAAPYSTPDATLGVDSVQERVYRGFCAHNEELAAAVERLEEKRGDLEALFLDASLPDPRGREAAWKYLVGFYDLIANPKRLERSIVLRCRGPSGE